MQRGVKYNEMWKYFSSVLADDDDGGEIECAAFRVNKNKLKSEI